MNNILTVILTPEGEQQLLNYYKQISKLSTYLGTKYLANPLEILNNKRNIDGSYTFTTTELINIFFENSSCLSKAKVKKRT